MPGLLDNLVRIDHLDRAAARAAIEQPLALWNSELAAPGEQVSIEPALVEAVLDGVQTRAGRARCGRWRGSHGCARPDAVPAARAGSPLGGGARAGSRVLRLQTLQRLNGAEQIVALHVDTAIAKMTVGEQAAAAKVLRQLVTPSGSKIALRSADLAEYAALDETTVLAVLERLTREARILQAIGDSRYEIYHDALARPILEWRRRWQAEQDRARERRRNRIAAAIGGGLLLTVVVVTILAVLALGERDADRRRATRTLSRSPRRAIRAERSPTSPCCSRWRAGRRDRETRRSLLAARRRPGRGRRRAGIIRGHSETVRRRCRVRSAGRRWPRPGTMAESCCRTRPRIAGVAPRSRASRARDPQWRSARRAAARRRRRRRPSSGSGRLRPAVSAWSPRAARTYRARVQRRRPDALSCRDRSLDPVRQRAQRSRRPVAR